ncbi:Vacuolar protein sorting-associated protein vps5 [Basidiobolus ranarum]|uniref:Vacuolar protein sorting-associated protein vps5 n=1 Tax=Basidiobolus ranarum TaxID=34480 RepID=A0ABR2VW02_9FUNG
MNSHQFYDDFSDLLSSKDGLSIKYEEVNPFADVYSPLASSTRRPSDSFQPAGYVDPHQEEYFQTSFSNLNFIENELITNSNGFTSSTFEELERKNASSPFTFTQEEEQTLPVSSIPTKNYDSPSQKDFPTSEPGDEIYSSSPFSSFKDYSSSPVTHFKASVREPTYNILDGEVTSPKMVSKPTEKVKEASVKSFIPVDNVEVTLADVYLPEDEIQNSQRENTFNNNTDKDGMQPNLEVSVGEPQKVGDPINPYIVYKVKTKSTFPSFKRPELSVTRRYRDFLWLYDQLVSSHPGVIIPPVPEKHALGRFQDDFIEARRVALEKCLRKIAAHPKLNNDSDFKFFLESDNFSIEIKERKNASPKGLMKVFGDVVSSATNFSKFVETDEWLENKRGQVDTLEAQLKPLIKIFDNLIKHRKELGGTHLEFGQSIDMLAIAEPNQPLTNNLMALSQVQKKIKELKDQQATHNDLELESTLDEYLRTIGSIRLAFNARIKSNQNWQNSVADFNKKRSQLEKLRSQSQPNQERISQLAQETMEARSRVDQDKAEFDNVGSVLKQELIRFDEEKANDFKISLEKYLRSTISTQMEIVSLWEAYLASTNLAQQQLLDHHKRQISKTTRKE